VRKPDTPCSSCGRLRYRGKGSRPEIVCHECRRQSPEYQQRKLQQQDREPRPVLSEEERRRRRREKDRRRRANFTPEQKQRDATRTRNRSQARCRARHLRHALTWDGITDEEILERDRWRCGICGRRIGKTYKYPHLRSKSIDHIIPLSEGGDDVAANKRAAHLGCNMARGNGGGGEQLLLIGSLRQPDRTNERIGQPYQPRRRPKGYSCGCGQPRLHRRPYCADCMKQQQQSRAQQYEQRQQQRVAVVEKRARTAAQRKEAAELLCAGLTTYQVAARLGVSQPTIGRWSLAELGPRGRWG
jgi:hypothetical protein